MPAAMWDNLLAAVDEVHAAVNKATVPDAVPPADRPVAWLLGALEGGDELAARVDGALAKRLRSRPPALCVAKALLLVHRAALSGHAHRLSESVAEVLAAAIAESDDTAADPHGAYVALCAGYVHALCGWADAASLRLGGTPNAWRDAPLHRVRDRLPPMQELLGRVLECASLGMSPSAPIEALRLALVEDALCLFRACVAGVANLTDGMLGLQPRHVGGRDGALAVYEAFTLHAAQVPRDASSGHRLFGLTRGGGMRRRLRCSRACRRSFSSRRRARPSPRAG